ncbi:MAG: ATP-dependent helicase [Candidatus Levybacteria bacterium]|nr:ATP-dependent helicase [Candidatus Levybacteria bacterium]
MPQAIILNDAQHDAVTHGEGPLIIIAGAGTGKTTVVTERIKHLILKKNIHHSQILALTFTDKAAREMEERVDIAMPYGYTQMWIATFHAFCDRILRTEAIHIGLNPSYKLMTEAETVMFLRKNIFAFKLDYFRPLGNPNKFLEGLLQHFSRLADEDVSPTDYLKYAAKLNAKRLSLDADKIEAKKTLELANMYLKYEELKAREGVMDFSDLITNTLKLFRERKNILRQYQEQFHYILVDEFQDTNFAQNQLAVLLTGKRKNITVVGDDDQAIYRWRGAAISNIIQFRKQFPDTKIIALTGNYRSTQEILDSAYTLIQHNNPDRLEVKEKVVKKLRAMRKVKGKEIELLWGTRVEDEADCVAKKIQLLLAKKQYEYKDIAILIRANDHAQAFVRALLRHNIPFQFLGPGKLFHQDEIKDLIAYLKVLYSFEDTTSLYRVLTMPVFLLEMRDIAALLNLARRKNLTLFEALEKVVQKRVADSLPIHEKTIEELQKIYSMLKRHLNLVPKETAGQILYYFLQDSGLLKKFLEPKSEYEMKRYQNIAKFFEKLKSYEAEHEDASVFAVVDWIDLSMQMGESPLATDMDWNENNAVNILTIHASKGLEFPIVFLVNLVSQRFPTRERKEQIPIPQELIKEILPEGDFHMQEERRLFYVGMTRSCDYLFFTAANFYGEGKRERKISPFVYEALGEKAVNDAILRQKAQSAVVQPSLLDWAERQSKLTSNLKPQTSVPITYLSFSQIQCFDLCPLHYKLRYILKIPPQPIAALSFGSSIHLTLKDFYQEVIAGRKPTKNDLLKFLENRWVDEGYTSKAHQSQARQRAQEILAQYFDKHSHLEHGRYPIGVEVPFQFYVTDRALRKRSLKLAGRIDRVDKVGENTIEIIDYKTGSNIPDEGDLVDNLQLTMYALAAANVNDTLFNRNPDDVTLSLYYIEEDKKISTTRTREQLEAAKEVIFKKVEEIEKSDFACSSGIFCRDCEYKMLCRV